MFPAHGERSEKKGKGRGNVSTHPVALIRPILGRRGGKTSRDPGAVAADRGPGRVREEGKKEKGKGGGIMWHVHLITSRATRRRKKDGLVCSSIGEKRPDRPGAGVRRGKKK